MKRIKIIKPYKEKKIYTCAKCGSECTPDKIWFYVDGNNGAITRNTKGYCQECKDK